MSSNRDSGANVLMLIGVIILAILTNNERLHYSTRLVAWVLLASFPGTLAFSILQGALRDHGFPNLVWMAFWPVFVSLLVLVAIAAVAILIVVSWATFRGGKRPYVNLFVGNAIACLSLFWVAQHWSGLGLLLGGALIYLAIAQIVDGMFNTRASQGAPERGTGSTTTIAESSRRLVVQFLVSLVVAIGTLLVMVNVPEGPAVWTAFFLFIVSAGSTVGTGMGLLIKKFSSA